LQAFFEDIACQNRHGPTFQAIRKLYQIAGQPPPLVTLRIEFSRRRPVSDVQAFWKYSDLQPSILFHLSVRR
jgi:hypothetical protein